MRRGLLQSAVAAFAAGLLLAVAAWLVDGAAGVAAAATGTAVAFGFLAVTGAVGTVFVGRDPLVLASALLGSWLAKAVLVLLVLWWARQAGLVPVWVGGGIVVGAAVTLWAQSRTILTSRVPYVDTESRLPDEDPRPGRT